MVDTLLLCLKYRRVQRLKGKREDRNISVDEEITFRKEKKKNIVKLPRIKLELWWGCYREVDFRTI